MQNLAADRLQLLWKIHEIVLDSGTTDDEKWDTIRELLEDNPLLNMTREDEAMLIGEANQIWDIE